MHAISYELRMLGFEISYMDSSWKNSLPVIFFLSQLSPFLELCPFEKISMKSCQQDISKSIWARGLKHGQLIGDDEKITWLKFKKNSPYFSGVMDSSWKNSLPVIFFLSQLSPFLELCPFEKISMKSCQQDISKSIWARGLKHGQLIGDDEKITWLKFKKNSPYFSGVMAVWKFGHFEKIRMKFFARYLEKYLS